MQPKCTLKTLLLCCFEVSESSRAAAPRGDKVLKNKEQFRPSVGHPEGLLLRSEIQTLPNNQKSFDLAADLF